MWDLQGLEATGGRQTQHTQPPKLLSHLTPVRYPATQSLWQETKDTAENTCQPQREMGEGDLADHFGISDLLETLDIQTKTRSWMYSLISHTTNSFLKKNKMK